MEYAPDDAGAEDWPDRQEITDPTAIDLLTDLRGLQMLTPFLSQTHTLTSAARVLCRPATSLAYWVPRFVAADLLERRGELRRAGVPMPRYRAPARKLVIPFERIPFDARVRLLDEGRLRILRRFFDGLDEALAASKSFGLSFAAYGDEGSVIDLEESDAARARRSYTDGWRTLELTEDDARTLSHDIDELVSRYTGRNGPRRFLCHAGVAPHPSIPWRSANDR